MRRFFSVSENFDLFGLPVDPGTGKPGRPRKEASEKDRNKIKLLLAIGWNVERMAGAVDMSLPTFRRVFFHELKARPMMRDRLYARRLEMAFNLAEAGNVAALKELGKMLEVQDRFFAEAEIARAQAGGQVEEPIGKKAQALAAAQKAGSGEGSNWGSDLDFSGRTRAN